MFPSGVSIEEVKKVAISAASSGDNTLVTAVAAANPQPAKKIRVLDYLIVAAGAVTAAFESGTSSGDITGVMSLITGVPNTPGFSPVGHFETTAGALLNLRLGGAVQVSGYLVYQEC